MATDLLISLKPGEEHEAHHDLESFFYILLWIALCYASPHSMERQEINVKKEYPVKHWVAEDAPLKQLGVSKLSSMSSLNRFFDHSIAKLFTKYVKDLAPCINKL